MARLLTPLLVARAVAGCGGDDDAAETTSADVEDRDAFLDEMDDVRAVVADGTRHHQTTIEVTNVPTGHSGSVLPFWRTGVVGV